MMVLCEVLAGCICAVVVGYLAAKFAQTSTGMSYAYSLLTYLRVAAILKKIGFTELMRPKRMLSITAPDGKKIPMSTEMFITTRAACAKVDVREDDVFVATYPKAGTTWMQEIVWLLCNNADIPKAKQTALTLRVPFLEFVDISNHMNGIQSVQNWPKDRQRIIKTHATYDVLPNDVIAGKKCKIVYVARNPKDVCVSYYFFHLANPMFIKPGEWNEFWTNFCEGNVDWGSWFSHTLGYWQKYQQKDKRIYFVTYEDLKKDLRTELAKLADFLQKDLTDDQLDAVARHCSFESMSKNDKVNNTKGGAEVLDASKAKFMRKGQVGDWKNYFTINQNATFDAMYEAKMKDSGLKMKFEL